MNTVFATYMPSEVKAAASKFARKRAEYYKYLAQILEASKGETKIADLFAKDSQRYDKKPRGVLAAYWHETYLNNGANLAETWEGTLPSDEVAIIRVAQDAGEGALQLALADVARIAALTDKVKSEVKGTLTVAFIGTALALVMVTAFPMFASKMLLETYRFIPFETWGPRGKAFTGYAQAVGDYGIFFGIAMGLIGFYVAWSINNLVGPARDWLDTNIALYRTVRDIKGAMFLSTMATLTRRRGNVMYTLGASLNTLAQSIRSPWLKWRVEEIVDGIETTGATGSSAFKTNLISEEMYFYLSDTQTARGFSEGFEETGKYVESTVVDSIAKRLAVYRWTLLLLGVAAVISIMGWQLSVIDEMRGVMMNYYSSR